MQTGDSSIVRRNVVWRIACGGLALLSVGSASRGVTASPTTVYETRSYAHPMPAAGAHLFGVADISDKYVGVLGWRGTAFTASEYNAFIFDASTGQHLWTFTQPVPPSQVNFRFSSLAIDGDTVVVGASYGSNVAFVYDLAAGQLEYTLGGGTGLSNSPGISVDLLGGKLAVGSWGEAYVFDAASGNQLARLMPSERTSQFGVSVALSESGIVVGSNSDESRGQFTGAVFVFDPQTYAQRSKFVPDDVGAFDNFGLNVAADGNQAIASTARGAHVFDMTTGALLQQLVQAGPSNYHNAVDIDGRVAILGNASINRAAVFDWTTGAELELLLASGGNPMNFGATVGLHGTSAIVASGGKAYQFQVVPEPAALALSLAAALSFASLRRRNG
jgi:hypothetical protein